MAKIPLLDRHKSEKSAKSYVWQLQTRVTVYCQCPHNTTCFIYRRREKIFFATLRAYEILAVAEQP
jgi:hypothetical protein